MMSRLFSYKKKEGLEGLEQILSSTFYTTFSFSLHFSPRIEDDARLDLARNTAEFPLEGFASASVRRLANRWAGPLPGKNSKAPESLATSQSTDIKTCITYPVCEA